MPKRKRLCYLNTRHILMTNKRKQDNYDYNIPYPFTLLPLCAHCKKYLINKVALHITTNYSRRIRYYCIDCCITIHHNIDIIPMLIEKLHTTTRYKHAYISTLKYIAHTYPNTILKYMPDVNISNT